MKKIVVLMAGAGVIGLFLGCSRPDQSSVAGVGVGTVTYLKGKADLVRKGNSVAIKVGDRFGEGDLVRTGARGIVVAVLSGQAAEVEIQPNSEFRIDQYSATSKKLALEKGNLWLRVNKREKGEEFSLRSPTAIAGVRGTKFFTFHIKDPKGRDYYGTCHCQGTVDFKGGTHGYSAVHSRDSIVMTRDGKTILLTPDDLQFMGRSTDHRHSALPNSPLGPQAVQLTSAQMRALLTVAERKFAQVK